MWSPHFSNGDRRMIMISDDNNITAPASSKGALVTKLTTFENEKQLAAACGDDICHLLDVWNSLAGVKPVTKFASRRIAIARIWKQIQGLAVPTRNDEPPIGPAKASRRGGKRDSHAPRIKVEPSHRSIRL